jgi:hypothetical protein
LKASKPRGRSPIAGIDTGIPVSIRFTAVYGFVDEYGDRWQWDCGQVVRNPFVISLLNGRNAPVEVLERRRSSMEKTEEQQCQGQVP